MSELHDKVRLEMQNILAEYKTKEESISNSLVSLLEEKLNDKLQGFDEEELLVFLLSAFIGTEVIEHAETKYSRSVDSSKN